MSEKTTVQAIYLEREMIRVEFANSSIVLDHPPGTGGGGKGPSPGHLMIGGMMAASMFSAIDGAKRLGVRLNSIVGRSGWKASREGKEGPLHALAFLSRIWRNLELEGTLNGVDGARLVGEVGLLETLRKGAALDERVTFSDAAVRIPPVEKNPHFLEYEKHVAGLAPGARKDDRTPPVWNLSATALDDDTVMIEMPGVPLFVSRTGASKRGPTPHELLLGGLVGCTAIYVGRNTPVHEIPLQRIEVTAAADTPRDLATPIRSIDKVTRIIGKLTDVEKEKVKFFSDFCALGETLKRGAEIIDNVVAKEAVQASDTHSPLANLARPSSPPADCDDGACCVPETQTGTELSLSRG